MYETIRQHFKKHIDITEAEFETCKSLLRYKKYRKHQYILQSGDICRWETFVLSGCTRTYETDVTGQEHVIQFGPENWWIGDLFSFLSGTPSRYNIDCLEDSEVLHISKADLEQLYSDVPKMERYFRLLIQNAYVASVERIYANLSKPAAERYQEFRSKYPDIEQRVSNQLIASYLGITPQSLSRIRSRTLKKK